MKISSTEVSPAMSFSLELEAELQAPIDRVFDAFTVDLPKWFPHRFVEGSDVHVELSLLGRTWEQWENGGTLQSIVTAFRRPDLVCYTNPGGMFGPWMSMHTYRFEEAGGITTVKLSLYAFGDVTDEHIGMYSNGYPGLFKLVQEYLG